MDYGFIDGLNVLMVDVFLINSLWLHKMLTDGLDWSGVDNLWIIVMFLSDVWTLILTAPIHCSRGSILVKLN